MSGLEKNMYVHNRKRLTIDHASRNLHSQNRCSIHSSLYFSSKYLSNLPAGGYPWCLLDHLMIHSAVRIRFTAIKMDNTYVKACEMSDPKDSEAIISINGIQYFANITPEMPHTIVILRQMIPSRFIKHLL